MSVQHDLDIGDQTAPEAQRDVAAAFLALARLNAGDSPPPPRRDENGRAVPLPLGTFWLDTSVLDGPQLKRKTAMAPETWRAYPLGPEAEAPGITPRRGKFTLMAGDGGTAATFECINGKRVLTAARFDGAINADWESIDPDKATSRRFAQTQNYNGRTFDGARDFAVGIEDLIPVDSAPVAWHVSGSEAVPTMPGPLHLWKDRPGYVREFGSSRHPVTPWTALVLYLSVRAANSFDPEWRALYAKQVARATRSGGRR